MERVIGQIWMPFLLMKMIYGQLMQMKKIEEKSRDPGTKNQWNIKLSGIKCIRYKNNNNNKFMLETKS